MKGPLDVVWLAETGGWGSLRVVVHFDLLAVWAGTEMLEARDMDMQESKSSHAHLVDAGFDAQGAKWESLTRALCCPGEDEASGDAHCH